MTVNPETANFDREDRIRALAYRLREEDGQPEGMAEEHWRRASEIIDAEESEDGVTEQHPDWLKRSPALESAPEPPSGTASKSEVEDIPPSPAAAGPKRSAAK